MITKNIFPIEWQLPNLPIVPYHGKNVFGTFICGGGSTMGYKMAGYNHLGGVEFTQHYADVYSANHKPKYLFIEDIRDFNKRTDLPDELYHLDLLDGSPPCAAFSNAGKREKLWGTKTEYEGKMQQKDDLIMVYSETINKLMPKVFLLENVAGLVHGNAKAYMRKVMGKLNVNYTTQIFLLYAASMGVPQIRNRVFIIGHQKHLNLPKLKLDFDCKPVPFEITRKFWHLNRDEDRLDRFKLGEYYDQTKIGTAHEKRFGLYRPHPKKVCPTLVAGGAATGAAGITHPYQKRKLNKEELTLLSTFPTDYNFLNLHPLNVMGRSVLPVMMANVSYQIYLQWLTLL